MLDTVRRWLTGGGSVPAWKDFAAWAKEHGWALKRAMSGDGWVMEDAIGRPGWRIEWGPSQRLFMGTHEFRIRVELAPGPEVQALVLDRPLLSRLDRELYEQFTDHVQTRLDDETPEEMRWLAMHAKLSPNAMGVDLRDRYGAVGDEPDWVARWLEGPLAQALKARAELLPVASVAAEPFLLRLARGQLVIRQAAPRPRPAMLQACCAIAEAGQQALAGMG